MVYRDLCREKEILEQVPDKQTTEITVKLLAQGKSKEQDFKSLLKIKKGKNETKFWFKLMVFSLLYVFGEQIEYKPSVLNP